MNLHCDLGLENNNQIFTQKNTPAYSDVPSIKFGSRKINSSVDVVGTVIPDYTSPQPDPEHEDSKPIFLHDTLAHDVASPYQVCLQQVQRLGTYHPNEHTLEF